MFYGRLTLRLSEAQLLHPVLHRLYIQVLSVIQLPMLQISREVGKCRSGQALKLRRIRSQYAAENK